MAKRKPLTDLDGEVRELTERDFARAKPFSALPKKLQATLRAVGQRGPQKAPTKERITIRLSPDVVERFKASGPGWQTRVDEALRSWLRRNSPGT